MRIIERRILSNFCRRHADAEDPLVTWREQVKKAEWKTPAELKQQYGFQYKGEYLPSCGGDQLYDWCG